jgi:hypothetical protein
MSTNERKLDLFDRVKLTRTIHQIDIVFNCENDVEMKNLLKTKF